MNCIASLGVGREGCLEREALGVEVAGEGLQRGASEGVDQADERPVRRDEDRLAIRAELEASPVHVLLR